jgi:hypothetical protein
MKEKIDPLTFFNWQVKKAYATKNDFLIEQANLNRDIYIYSKNLTIEDWRIIRSGNYYQMRDKLKGNELMKFILEKIRYYR